MGDCLRCKITKFLDESGLSASVQVSYSKDSLTITGKCGCEKCAPTSTPVDAGVQAKSQGEAKKAPVEAKKSAKETSQAPAKEGKTSNDEVTKSPEPEKNKVETAPPKPKPKVAEKQAQKPAPKKEEAPAPAEAEAAKPAKESPAAKKEKAAAPAEGAPAKPAKKGSATKKEGTAAAEGAAPKPAKDNAAVKKEEKAAPAEAPAAKPAKKAAAAKKEPAPAPATGEAAQSEKKRSTTKKAVAEAPPPPPPVQIKPKVLKLSFVFQRVKDQSVGQFFTMVKPAVYYAFGGRDSMAEVSQHLEDFEASLWEQRFPEVMPNSLNAVHITIPWENPDKDIAKYEKVRDLFKDAIRLVVMDREAKQVFRPAVKNDKDKRPKAAPRDLSNVECLQCKEKGHLARDCPTKKNRREAGKGGAGKGGAGKGEAADKDTESPSAEEKAERPPIQCRNCQEFGHIAKECPVPKEPKEVQCWYCNESGHVSRECPKKQEQAAKAASTLVCYNCNGTGHLARDCTQERQPRKSDVVCHNCSQSGHLARNCPEEPKDGRRKPEGEQADASGERRAPKRAAPREPRPLKCEREVRDRDGKTVQRGCGGAHAYLDCPLHKCVHCQDNHLSSRCPFMAR